MSFFDDLDPTKTTTTPAKKPQTTPQPVAKAQTGGFFSDLVTEPTPSPTVSPSKTTTTPTNVPVMTSTPPVVEDAGMFSNFLSGYKKVAASFIADTTTTLAGLASMPRDLAIYGTKAVQAFGQGVSKGMDNPRSLSDPNWGQSRKGEAKPSTINTFYQDVIDELGKGRLDQSNWDTKIQTKAKNFADELQLSRGVDPNNRTFGQNLGGGFGSMAGFFIPSFGAAKVASLLTKTEKAAELYSKVGGISMTLNESFMEGDQVFQDVYNKTGNIQEAQKKADNTVYANVALIGITNKYSKYFENTAPGFRNLVKSALTTAISEGPVQEGGQQIISNLNSGRPIFEGVVDSAVIGAIVGGVTHVATRNLAPEGGVVIPPKEGDKPEKNIFQKLKEKIFEDNKDNPVVVEYAKNDKIMTDTLDYIAGTKEIETPEQVKQTLVDNGMDEETAVQMMNEAVLQDIRNQDAQSLSPEDIQAEIDAFMGTVPNGTTGTEQTGKVQDSTDITPQNDQVGKVNEMVKSESPIDLSALPKEEQVKAQVEWDNNYAEDYSMNQADLERLQTKLKTDKGETKRVTKARISDIEDRIKKSEEEFLKKYAPEEFKQEQVLSNKYTEVKDNNVPTFETAPLNKEFDQNPTYFKKGEYVIGRDGQVAEVTSGNDTYKPEDPLFSMNVGSLRTKRIGDTKDYVEYANQVRIATDSEIATAEEYHKNKKSIKVEKPKTQKDKVKEVLGTKEKASIKEIADATGILEPNVRRILGVGAKEGDFERVADGVYRITDSKGNEVAVIIPEDALVALPQLVKDGFKADMVFLDIPYDTKAVKGGNRGVEYNLISVKQFSELLDSVKEILRTENSPIIHMYSQAVSGMSEMQEYNNLFTEKGFIAVGKGEYQKTYKDGKPVAFPTSKGSMVTKPEGILVFNKSGELTKELDSLQFTLVRPNGYQTEKPAEMLKKMIEMTTNEGDIVLDPFAGSGVTGAEAVKAGRKAVLVEKNKEVAENITKPRVEGAVPKTTDIQVGDVFDTGGVTNMKSPVTVTEIEGRSIKFDDADGTGYQPFETKVVKDFIKEGVWTKQENDNKVSKNEFEVLKKGTKVSFEEKGKTLTGEVKSSYPDGTTSVDVDQMEVVGGIPIGRISVLDTSRLTVLDKATEESTIISNEQGNRPSTISDTSNLPTKTDMGGGGEVAGEISGYDRATMLVESGNGFGTDSTSKLTKKQRQLVNEQVEALLETKEYSTDPDTYSIQELDLMRAYSGAGGKESVGGEGAGLLNEYYTPREVILHMWNIVERLMPNAETAFEPSAGTGKIITEAPASIKVDGAEISKVSGTIAQVLNPDSNISIGDFQELFFDKKTNKKKAIQQYDVLIGNPPFGAREGFLKGKGEESTINRQEEYFIKRGLDMTKEGGYLVYVVNSSFLKTGSSKGKVAISKIGNLVGAYRLPENSFEDTSIGTDIVIFRKEAGATPMITNDQYFEENPTNKLGAHMLRKNRFGQTESYVKGDLDSALKLLGTLLPEPVKTIDIVEEPVQTTIKLSQLADIMGIPFTEVTEEPITPIETKEPKQKKATKAEIDHLLGKDKKKTAKASKVVEDSSKTLPKENWEELVIPVQNVSNKKGATPTEVAMLKRIDRDLSIPNPSDSELPYLNYEDGKYYPDAIYYSGNIAKKLKYLEDNKKTVVEQVGEAKYDKQVEGLHKARPELVMLKDIAFDPMDRHVVNLKLNDERGNEITVLQAFTRFISRRDAVALSPRVTISDIRKYVNQERANNGTKPITGHIMEDATRLFNQFMKTELEPEIAKQVQDKFNVEKNAIVTVDYSQLPVEIQNMAEKFRGQIFQMSETQRNGVGFLVNKGSGIIAYGVGVGKTHTLAIATVANMQKGWSKRPLFTVPSATISKTWLATLHEMFPDLVINNLDGLQADVVRRLKKARGEDTKNWIKDGELTILSHKGLLRLGFKDNELEMAIGDLNDAMVSAPAKKTKRAGEVEKDKAEGILGGAQKYVTDIMVSDLGIDHISVDEVHNFRKIFQGAKPENTDEEGNQVGQKRFGNVIGGTPAKQAQALFLLTQYIQRNNNGRNVFLASATPFENHATEVYSILSLVARDRLKQMGIYNINDFFALFAKFEVESDRRLDGEWLNRSKMKGYNNLPTLQKLIREFIDRQEDPTLIRPEKKVLTPHLAMSELQKDNLGKIQELLTGVKAMVNDTEAFNEESATMYDVASDDGEVEEGAFLKASTYSIANSVSPYFIKEYTTVRPTGEQIIEDSPKIKYALEVAKRVKNNPKTKDFGTFLYFGKHGVDFHPLLAETFAKELGYDKSQVSYLSGKMTEEEKEKVKEDFNSGKTKVLIGGDQTKEGIDLQNNGFVTVNLALGWNPTEVQQVGGRVWRQGNNRSFVFEIYPLVENSGDATIYNKFEEKGGRINDIFSYAGMTFDVGEVDPAEKKLALLTDPKDKAKMQIEIDRTVYSNEHVLVDNDIKSLNKISADLNESKGSIPYYEKELANEYLSDFRKKEYKADLKAAKDRVIRLEKKLSDKGITDVRATIGELQAKLVDLEAKMKGVEDTYEPLLAKFTEQYKVIQKNRKSIEQYMGDIDSQIETLQERTPAEVAQMRAKKIAELEAMKNKLPEFQRIEDNPEDIRVAQTLSAEAYDLFKAHEVGNITKEQFDTRYEELTKKFNALKLAQFERLPTDKKFYHGTLETFDKFSLDKVGQNTGFGNAKFGFFFTEIKSRAEDFIETTRPAGDTRTGTVKEVYLDIKNPLDLTMHGIFTNTEQAPFVASLLLGEEGLSSEEAIATLEENIGLGEIGEMDDNLYTLENKKRMEEAGYDGIISEFGYDENNDLIKEFVAFNPEQVINAGTQAFEKVQKQMKEPMIKFDEGKKRIEAYKKRLGLHFNVDFADVIFTGEFLNGVVPVKAYAVTYNGKITLTENIKLTTADHEMVHIVVDNIEKIDAFDGITKEQLLRAQNKGKAYTQADYERLNEELAIGFQRKVLGEEQSSVPMVVRRFYDKLQILLTDLFRAMGMHVNIIEDFYRKMSVAKATTNVTTESSSILDMRAQYSRNGVKGLDFSFEQMKEMDDMRRKLFERVANETSIDIKNFSLDRKDLGWFNNYLANAKNIYISNRKEFKAAKMIDTTSDKRLMQKEMADKRVAEVLKPYFALEMKDIAKVNAVLMMGDEARTEYDTEQLRKAGLNDSQIEAYGAVRIAFNRAHRNLLAEMAKNGASQEQIKDFERELKGYIPHKWKYNNAVKFYEPTEKGYIEFETKQNLIAEINKNGPEFARELLANGILKISSMSTYKTEGEAKKAVSETLANGDLAIFTKLTSLSVDFFSEQRFSIGNMKTVIAQAKVAQDVKDQLLGGLSDLVKEKGFGRQYIHRGGVAGYEKEDLAPVIANYFSGLNGFITKMEAGKEYFTALESIKERDQPRFYAWIRDTIAFDMGNTVNTIAPKIPGTDVRVDVKEVAFVTHLAWDLSYMLINATQNLTIGVGELSTLVDGTVAKLYKPEVEVMKAVTDYATGKISAEEKLVIDGLLSVGRLGGEMTAELMDFKNNPLYRTISSDIRKALYASSAGVEKNLNRVPAFLAARRLLELKGVTVKEGLNEQALEMSDKIHIRAKKTNLPRAFRGPIGGVVFIFQNFTREMMYGMYENLSQKQFMAFSKKMFYTMLLGGATSLPFAKMILAIVKWLFPDPDDEVADELYTWELALKRGIPASYANIDLSGRVSFDIMTVTSLFEGETPKSTFEKVFDIRNTMGAVSGVFARAFDGYTLFTQGRYLEAGGKLPDFIGNPLKAYQGYSNGVYSKAGNPLMDKEGEVFMYTPYEAFVKATGFTPTREQLAWDESAKKWISKQIQSEKSSGAQTMIKAAILQGDINKAQELQQEGLASGALTDKSKDYVKDAVKEKTLKDNLEKWNTATKSRALLDKMERDMTKEIHGDSYTPAQLTNVTRDFAFYRTFGMNDKLANEVKGAQTVADKVEILKKARETMTLEEFKAFYKKGRTVVRYENTSKGAENTGYVLITDSVRDAYFKK